MTNSISEATIPPSGRTFRLKDLPPEFRDQLPKDWIGDSVTIKLEPVWFFGPIPGGFTLDSPIYPYVKNDRLFVDVTLPFRNERHLISMSDDSDSEIPNIWDRNYSSNAFEIVREDGLPVLQVFYKRPNEIQVNGIFVIETNFVFAAFGNYTEFAQNLIGGNPIHIIIGTAQEVIPATNMEQIFTMTFSNQIPIFKYPSWRHLGEYAN